MTQQSSLNQFLKKNLFIQMLFSNKRPISQNIENYVKRVKLLHTETENEHYFKNFDTGYCYNYSLTDVNIRCS
jgi:hypothetical protein